MSSPLRGVIVSHAAVAQALITAVANITGVTDALVPVSNDGCDREALYASLAAPSVETPAVLFIDLPGGSCLTGAATYARRPSRSRGGDRREPGRCCWTSCFTATCSGAPPPSAPRRRGQSHPRARGA